MMLEKILVPLDGTRGSEMSISYAQNIAKAYDSQIVLFMVNEASQYHGQMPVLRHIPTQRLE